MSHHKLSPLMLLLGFVVISPFVWHTFKYVRWVGSS